LINPHQKKAGQKSRQCGEFSLGGEVLDQKWIQKPEEGLGLRFEILRRKTAEITTNPCLRSQMRCLLEAKSL